ncbi:copper homeostasis protein CutC [Mucilaginibacter lacusdianchii]|uniref:copper homeostasis protein CutC n=1 Tax=Mucilaginibacter lacusdianchii TaxID=2684211 RepID=UPI00131C9365|nr:copper homeostasis protein CutC [Mucilaginibacter sp. JXJ CY 39]
MVFLEVCANSITSALAAQQGGASRVELCENLTEGGTTPSYGQMKLTRQLLNIPVHVLLRPRTGDFLYNDLEFEIIKADLQCAIDLGCNGVVLGILNADGTIDIGRCKQLIDLAKQHNLHVTFHRAFDFCTDMFQALEQIIALGCDTILTSGGKPTAIEGAGTIAQLFLQAKGRIDIMPGGGLSEYNVADLVHFTGSTFIHSSAKARHKTAMTYKKENIMMSGANVDEYDILTTDVERVKAIISLANGNQHH